MRNQRIHHSIWMMSVGFLILVIAGCASFLSQNATETPVSISTKKPTIQPAVSALPTQREIISSKNILYEDDFTNPAGGWPKEKLDNYYTGYHEPEYFQVQLQSPNFKHLVYAPEKKIYEDITVQLKVLTEIAWPGDFRYGLIFRRSGDLYYAFTISPTTRKWYVLKSNSDGLQAPLKEGIEESIQGVGSEDTLRVDAKGNIFSFYINDKQVAQVSDPDYASGEVGLFVQTLDSRKAHIHFDSLIIRDVEASQIQASSLYRDDFTNPASGWPKVKLDNYFIGYHEPEYFQVQLQSSDFKYPIYAPNKKVYKDITVQLKVLTEIAWPGDFRYGLIFRRSGDLYYAFLISPTTKNWYVLKSNSNGLVPLEDDIEEGIQGVGGEDTLRVDAKGDTFYFHINNKQVAQISDPDYASGEVGLFVQTLDSSSAHIHFDELTIWEFQTPLLDTSSPPGTENCTNGEDEDGDNLIDAADPECVNVSIPLDHHNGANGVVSVTNCSKCHSFPGSPPPTVLASNAGSGSNNTQAHDHHNGANGPVSVGNCSSCHSLPWATPPPAGTNPQNGRTPTVMPTRQKPNPHPPLDPSSCTLCHANGTPTAGGPILTATAGSPIVTIFTPTRIKPNPHPPPGQSCNVCHAGGIPTPVTPKTNTPDITNTSELPPTSTPEPATTEPPAPTTEPPPPATTEPPYP